MKILLSILVLAAATPPASAQVNGNELLNAIEKVESSCRPSAESKAGARGAFQFMPSTWAWLWRDIIKEPQYCNFKYAFNRSLSRRACNAYLKYIAAQLSKRGMASLDNVLASYNCGLGNVIKHRGIPPFKETVEYIKKVRKELHMESTTTVSNPNAFLNNISHAQGGGDVMPRSGAIVPNGDGSALGTVLIGGAIAAAVALVGGGIYWAYKRIYGESPDKGVKTAPAQAVGTPFIASECAKLYEQPSARHFETLAASNLKLSEALNRHASLVAKAVAAELKQASAGMAESKQTPATASISAPTPALAGV